LAPAQSPTRLCFLAEPVKLVETDFQDFFCAPSFGCGLLIQATPGRAGGVGTLLIALGMACDELAPVLAALRTTLAHDPFERALSEGRALSLGEAVTYARRGRGNHNRARSGWASLTTAELKVVPLVGQHLTNAEIAERLFLSTATVKGHLNRVFAKVGVRERGQLAAAAHHRETA